MSSPYCCRILRLRRVAEAAQVRGDHAQARGRQRPGPDAATDGGRQGSRGAAARVSPRRSRGRGKERPFTSTVFVKRLRSCATSVSCDPRRASPDRHRPRYATMPRDHAPCDPSTPHSLARMSGELLRVAVLQVVVTLSRMPSRADEPRIPLDARTDARAPIAAEHPLRQWNRRGHSHADQGQTDGSTPWPGESVREEKPQPGSECRACGDDEAQHRHRQPYGAHARK